MKGKSLVLCVNATHVTCTAFSARVSSVIAGWPRQCCELHAVLNDQGDCARSEPVAGTYFKGVGIRGTNHVNLQSSRNKSKDFRSAKSHEGAKNKTCVSHTFVRVPRHLAAVHC
eukprot:1715545-Amphidinium_carterae.1